MPKEISAVLTSLDGVEAPIAELYQKGEDGKFRPTIKAVDGWGLENVQGLRTGLDKERENVKTLANSIKQFEGLDPVKAREALTKLEQMKDWKPEDKVKEHVEQRLAELREKMGKDIAARDERIKSMSSSLEEALVVSAATTEIEKAKGSSKLLMPYVKTRVKVVESDGKYAVQVVDASGNVMKTAKSNYKDAATISDLIEEFKNDSEFSKAFDSSGQQGSGSSSSSRSGNRGGSHTISAEDARDMNLYRAASEAAQKAGKQLQIVS